MGRGAAGRQHLNKREGAKGTRTTEEREREVMLLPVKTRQAISIDLLVKLHEPVTGWSPQAGRGADKPRLRREA